MARELETAIRFLDGELKFAIRLIDSESAIRDAIQSTGDSQDDPVQAEMIWRAGPLLMVGQLVFLRIANRAAAQLIAKYRPSVAATLAASGSDLQAARESLRVLRQIHSEHALI